MLFYSLYWWQGEGYKGGNLQFLERRKGPKIKGEMANEY